MRVRIIINYNTSFLDTVKCSKVEMMARCLAKIKRSLIFSFQSGNASPFFSKISTNLFANTTSSKFTFSLVVINCARRVFSIALKIIRAMWIPVQVQTNS
ncbi:hypothetical protein O6H91_07G069200 [Diphasiastrum complanatum]|uniref:Uncharacterized protein n=1 Tax=Diphasiastrum complanatum TaxID=34168 RepID=A0ACC2D6K1_DIPCM|nr:hypothetical protein O6H91_07G069200 [Diphasiastrum complanatum]